MVQKIKLPYLFFDKTWNEWTIYFLNENNEWAMSAAKTHASAQNKMHEIERKGLSRDISISSIQKYIGEYSALVFFCENGAIDNYVFRDRNDAQRYLDTMIEGDRYAT